MDAGIEVTDLTKVYEDARRGPVRAVDGISFRAAPGRIFGLLGPNGAGKTTTLRVLATLIRPTSGQVRVEGRDVTEAPREVRRALGFLSTATGLYERSTAREILRFFGELEGLGGALLDDRIEDLARRFSMEAFMDRACGRLSTGQRQKVGIARTVVHDPPVLILDEPTNGLDVIVAREVIAFMAEQRERGRTVLLSTHIMSEADRLCDDVAVVHEGRLLISGPREDVLEQAGATGLEDAFFNLLPTRADDDRGLL